jgi:hypothetical protein
LGREDERHGRRLRAEALATWVIGVPRLAFGRVAPSTCRSAGTSMASMRSIEAGVQQLVPDRHLQNDVTAARLPATSPKNARTGAADSPASSPSWWATNPVRSLR